MGGMALHHGKIAEMRTGEGKTLTATLPVYLNALTGKGVHVVTVNDYLANRDAQWMGKLYNFLGLTVGVNLPHMPREEKQAAYGSDITYGTNNEFGFDYLRDNMVYETGDRVQRGLNYAIVDEVDSILIDEARTPLIISGQAEDHTDLYLRDEPRRAAAHASRKAKPTRAPAKASPSRATSRSTRRRTRCSSPSRATRTRSASCQPGADPRGRDAVRPGQHHADASPECGAAAPTTCTTATSTTWCRTARSSSSTSSPAA